jgi:translation elongation factor EF-Ts
MVGVPTTGITAPSSVEPVGEGEISPYLLEQPFMMFQNEQRLVKEVLESWGGERQVSLKVSGMRRWAVGEEDVEA